MRLRHLAPRLAPGLALGLALVALLALPAGQAQAQIDQGPSPAVVAAARARADALIAAAGAQAVFENATNGFAPLARHRASGLLCFFDADRMDQIEVAPKGERESDVRCRWFPAGVSMTTHASRRPASLSLEGAYAGSEREIRRTHADARPHNGPMRPLSEPEVTARSALPEIRTGRFMVTTPTGPAYARVSVAIVNGWVVEQSATGPLSGIDLVDALADRFLVTSLQSVAGQPYTPR